MTTAVVYASKYGTTAEIARLIADALGPDARLFDLADGDPELGDCDTVVLGTAIYAGKPLPTMKSFPWSTIPPTAKVALFAGGMEKDPAKRQAELAAAFPQELADRAITTAFLGGRFQFARMKAAERFIIKRIAKSTSDVEAIDHQAIAQFAEEVAAASPPT